MVGGGASSTLLARCLDQVLDFTLVVHAVTGRVLAASERAAAALGYSADELVGVPASAFSDTAALGWERLRDRVREAGGQLSLDSAYRTRAGESIPVALSVRAVDADGEPGLLAVVHPVPPREGGGARDLRYEAAFARSQEAMLLHVPWGRIIDVNAAAEALFRRTRSELLGLDVVNLLAAPPLEGTEHEVTDVLTGRGQVRFERRLGRGDGTTFQAEVSATRLDFAGGTLIQALIRDVTEHREHVERLSQAARIFESLAEGVVVTRLDGTIVQVNPAFTRITGWEPHEILGQTPRLLKSGRHDDAFYRAMWTQLAAEGRWQGEVWNRRRDGTVYPEWLTVSVVLDADGCPKHYVSVMSDITQLKQTQNQLDRLAHHDPLTGLPNRLRFLQRLDEAILGARAASRRVAVVFVDVDHFKDVNDTLGHAAGDTLLRAVASRLGAGLRERDLVARLGGDEFVLLLEGVRGLDDAVQVASRALDALRLPVAIDGLEVRVTASLGVSIWPDHASDADTLMKHADLAMYRAKEGGRNAVGVYTPELSARLGERFTLETALRGALERGELTLAWLPQVELRTGRPLTLEALLRWSHAQVGDVSPDRLIPVAEWIGLIQPIGAWVLREACAAASRLRAAGLPFERVSVNVAGRQALAEGFADLVLAELAAHDLYPRDLELEVTERALHDDLFGDAFASLERLRRDGVRIAIDDFGTGYSSLSRLKHLPVDVLKIDKSFIDGLPDDADDLAISSAIVALARALGLAVSAEGIASELQLTAVRALGCTRGQGFHVAPPMGEDELVPWLRERAALSAGRGMSSRARRPRR